MGTGVTPRLATTDIAGATERVTRVVAGVLRVETHALDPQRPLSVYGLDSLSAMELVARLEDEFHTSLPEWLLAECPDIDAVGDLAASGRSAQGRSLLDRLRATACCPRIFSPPSAIPSIRPARS